MRVLYCEIKDRTSNDIFYSYVAVLENSKEDELLDNLDMDKIDSILKKEFGLLDRDIQYYFTSGDKAFVDNKTASNGEFDYKITK